MGKTMLKLTTNVGPDTQDLYTIKVNPDNEFQYEWNGEWRDMTVYEETIRFGDGGDPVTIKVRQTHLGPIINDNQIDSETGEIKGFNNEDPMAFHWTATAETSTVLQAIMGFNRAANWEQFREAARYFDVPAQNLVYADVEGNIGYQTPGRIPIRAEGHTGLLPVDGTTDQYEWKGYILLDDRLACAEPERGWHRHRQPGRRAAGILRPASRKAGRPPGEDSNYYTARSGLSATAPNASRNCCKRPPAFHRDYVGHSGRHEVRQRG
jgi:acyl-homoserine lactone acylase PvdQ